MTPIQRSLIEKAGYDNGWEVVVSSTQDEITLGSALHRSKARILVNEEAGFRISLPPGQLASELSRESESTSDQDTFLVPDTAALALLLRRAADLARSLPDLPETRFRAKVAEELSHLTVGKTEVERLVRQRVGQDIFRESLMDYWGGACAVTGIAVPELLRSSHIRPWADCASDAERLNVFNGILLCAHLDALFDRHLMTFDDSGTALFSPRLPEPELLSIGVFKGLHLRWVAPEHRNFLLFHRDRFQTTLHPSETNS